MRLNLQSFYYEGCDIKSTVRKGCKNLRNQLITAEKVETVESKTCGYEESAKL